MRPPRRLESHPLTSLDRGSELTFRHEGKSVRGYEGETIAAALYANGTTILGRSMRYHRARGLYCGTGACTHCFLRIDGQPNQRACQTRCTKTTWSEGQNAFPNVRWDVLEGADLAYPEYLDAHRAFVRPKILRPLFTRIIRGMAGYGRVPRTPVPQTFLRQEETPEVLVVGAGPAGLAAAQSAAEAGARVLLVEAQPKVGGRLRHLPTPFRSTRSDRPEAEGKAFAAGSEARLRELGVAIRTGARVFGIYDDLWMAASSTTLVRIRPRAVVVATGALDRYEVFPGSDRAGVLQATAAAQLLNQWGIAPAEPVAILGATREGLLLARDLRACRVEIAGVYEPGDLHDSELVDEVRSKDVRIEAGWVPRFIGGRRAPRSIVFLTPRGRRRIACRTVVTASGRASLGQLFQQAEAELRFERISGSWTPVLDASLQTTRGGVFAAGACAGSADEWESVEQGRRAGGAAAQTAKERSVPPGPNGQHGPAMEVAAR